MGFVVPNKGRHMAPLTKERFNCTFLRPVRAAVFDELFLHLLHPLGANQVLRQLQPEPAGELPDRHHESGAGHSER